MDLQGSPSEESMRARGHRLTRHRKLVLQTIRESQQHLDAETIYIRAKNQDPSISLATVYRALAIFIQDGLVSEHQLGENHRHFELVQATPHYHFTCNRCGQVIEFEAPEVMETASGLGKTKGFQISEVHLLLSGLCKKCLQEEAGHLKRYMRK